MGTGIGIAAGGVVMSLVALALLTNYRRFGDKAATFGGSLTFMVGGVTPFADRAEPRRSGEWFY